MSRQTLADHLAVEHEGGGVVPCRLKSWVMVPARPLFRGSPGWLRSNGSDFSHTEHQRVLGRIQVQDHVLNGPASLVELDSTTVIHPGYQAEVDRFGNLILAAS